MNHICDCKCHTPLFKGMQIHVDPCCRVCEGCGNGITVGEYLGHICDCEAYIELFGAATELRGILLDGDDDENVEDEKVNPIDIVPVEYIIITVERKALLNELNKYGANGWNAYHMETVMLIGPHNLNDEDVIVVYFKQYSNKYIH